MTYIKFLFIVIISLGFPAMSMAEEATNLSQIPLQFFNFSYGLDVNGVPTGSDSCMTCGLFSSLIESFFKLEEMYGFLQEQFLAICGVVMGCYLALRIIQMFSVGAVDGMSFPTDIFKKFAIFYLIFLVLSGPFSIGPLEYKNSFEAVGLAPLNLSTKMATEYRGFAAYGGAMVGGGTLDGFSSTFCGEIDLSAEYSEQVKRAVERQACAIERTLAIPLSVSVGLIFGSFTDFSAANFGSLILQTITGVIMLLMVGLAFVYLLAMLFEGVIKTITMAALSPVWIFMFMFEPTRDVAQRAVKILLVGPIRIFALSIISTWIFYCYSFVTILYNWTYPVIQTAYKRQMSPLEGGTYIEKMQEFLTRITYHASEAGSIPTDITTPWGIYLLCVSFLAFQLNKKIFSELEGIFDIQSSTEFASSSMRKAGIVAVAGGSVMAATGVAQFFMTKGMVKGGYKTQKALRGMNGAAASLSLTGAAKALSAYSPFGRSTPNIKDIVNEAPSEEEFDEVGAVSDIAKRAANPFVRKK